MMRTQLLSGRGVMEYHLPSVLSKNIDFMLDSSKVEQTTNKDQNANTTPHALVFSNAVPPSKLLSGQGSIDHSRPTHLKRKHNFLCLPFIMKQRALSSAHKDDLYRIESEGSVSNAWRRTGRLISHHLRC